MKFCFVVYGPITFASSRLRAYWPAEHLEGAVVCDYATITTDRRPDADVYVFLKHGRPQAQADLLAAGKQVWWDACDPMWWFSPNEVRQIIAHVTGVTTSTAALASDFRQFSGMQAHVIPDRLKLEHYPMQREHGPQSPVRFVWYGIGVNRHSLLGAWANLCRLAANGYNVSLTLMDDYHGQGLGCDSRRG